MNREELLSLLRQHMGKGSELGDKLVEEIIRQVNAGLPLAEGINTALANTGFTGQYFNQLIDTICTAALLGYGIKVPSMQMKTVVRKHILSDYWAPDKMKLSKRLHGTSQEMRQAIIDTIAVAMRKGRTVRQMAIDLYDGYNSGNKVINGAELPQYLKRLVAAARSAAGGDRNITREFNLAVRKAEKQLVKMKEKDKPLRVAYQQLVDAAQMLNEKVMEKAAWVAVQEKARYYADRIAITESARAWSDMFYARHYDDSLVIGFGWRLSSRHPRVDICDFHAKVDHYGMGAGNYPKDKMPPHPAHPFCTCNLVVIYKGEAEPGKFNPEAGDSWLRAQDAKDLREMLGVEGAKAFEQDGKWQKRLRNWYGHKEPKLRGNLKDVLQLSATQNHATIKPHMIEKAEQIRQEYLKNGSTWKTGKLDEHLEKRKKLGHIPSDWTTEDYENKILEILRNKDTQVYLYYKKNFLQNFFVYGLPDWIVMVGENGVMETAFLIDRELKYDEYLAQANGFMRLDKKEDS